MWPVGLSARLPVVGSVGRHPAACLMGRGPVPLPRLRAHARAAMRPRGVAGRYPGFPPAIPGRGAGRPRVTHPFAADRPPRGAGPPLDLHVLGAPPAFILSQDRTLRSSVSRGRSRGPRRSPWPSLCALKAVSSVSGSQGSSRAPGGRREESIYPAAGGGARGRAGRTRDAHNAWAGAGGTRARGGAGEAHCQSLRTTPLACTASRPYTTSGVTRVTG